MAESESLTLTVSEAARVLGISRTTAYECVRTGQLRAVRLGRRLVVPRIAITELLAPQASGVDTVDTVDTVDAADVVGRVVPDSGSAVSA